MNLISDALAHLGRRGVDRVTSFEGFVSSVCFDAYGCVQCALSPSVREGKIGESYWFDIKRIDLGERVLAAPNFEIVKGEEAGAAEKPAPRS